MENNFFNLIIVFSRIFLEGKKLNKLKFRINLRFFNLNMIVFYKDDFGIYRLGDFQVSVFVDVVGKKRDEKNYYFVLVMK